MARTRASNGTETSKTDNPTTTTTTSKSRYTLPPPSDNPPKIFILPKKATDKARIVLLLHPRYAKPTRYLVCPETGFYEFTRIAAPKSTPRSWLIQTDGHASSTEKKGKDGANFGTYVTSGAELFVATPVDPLFLILPTLIDPSSKSERSRYISSDDHFDRIQEASPHLWEVMRWGEGAVRGLLEARLGAVCDTVEVGDEQMFRFSEEKLLREVLGKARRMSTKPLPRSMEEKFVVKPLEAPVLGVKRVATVTVTTTTTTTTLKDEETSTEPAQDESQIESVESQTSESVVDSSTSFASEASTAATSITPTQTPTPTQGDEDSAALAEALRPAMVASAEVLALQRLRTAFNFLCSSYIPAALVTLLRARLSSQPEAVDFAPLDAYMSELSRLKQEAAASRSAGDYARKRVLDDEEVEERAEKKRKKEEDDKRKKAGESRGVKNLKKVNTTGMKKMSDFFKKKA
ncbi:ribonuclease H2, subunit B [Astrocystis sublimbata]|nr:ribonuclease H2, subunit B [Astrocystis sublimbata]